MTQITEKVTAQRLDTMYGNFVKMTDWVLNGTASQHPMPAPYKAVFEAAQQAHTNAQTVQEQTKLIGALQQRLAQQDGRIAALEATLQSVNQTLTQLVEIANRQAQQTAASVQTSTQAQSDPAPQPVTPEPVATQQAQAQTKTVQQPVAQQPQAQEQAPASVQTSAQEQELADLSVIDVQAKPIAQTTHAQAVPQKAAQPAQAQAPAQAISPNEQAIQVSAAAVDAGNLDPASYAALDAEIAALTGALK